VPKIWGGRGLHLHLGKPFHWLHRYGESWEVADNRDGVTLIANGPLAGKTLQWLTREHGEELIGAKQRSAFPGRFPLIAKFLDATGLLSIQVHPDERTARSHFHEQPKTEAWYVVHARQGARIYCGTRRGVTREQLNRSLRSPRPLSCLHGFQPQPGQTVLIRGGTVHTLGHGVLVAEIQQSSNTTIRLHDFGRTRHARDHAPLDIDWGTRIVDYERGPVEPIPPPLAGRHCATLVECGKFVMKRLRLTDHANLNTTQTGFHILMALRGAGRLIWRGQPCKLAKGTTILVPASLGAYRLEGRMELLWAHLPTMWGSG
jgi:mannose-6-phosphate isomerase